MTQDLALYQVDAFASRAFTGNPAAVCPLEAWLPDETLQAIAMENNLAETAFLVPDGEDYQLRWFTPAIEVDLCGHATLASGYVVTGLLDKARTFPSRCTNFFTLSSSPTIRWPYTLTWNSVERIRLSIY